MDDDNPYASPRSSEPSAPSKPVALPRDGIWRQRDCLVVGRDARLPDICLVTNQPSEVRWQTKVRVLSPTRLACTLIFCPPIAFFWYIIFALEGTRMELPLARQVLDRRNLDRWVTTFLVLSGILLIFLDAMGVFNLLLSMPYGEGAVLGWIVILAGALYDSQFTQLFRVDRLTRDHTWLKGPSEAHLRRFEEFPG